MGLWGLRHADRIVQAVLLSCLQAALPRRQQETECLGHPATSIHG